MAHTRSLRLSLPFKHPNLRLYATANSSLIIAKPPNLPPLTSAPPPLDSFILETLARAPSTGRTALPQLVQQYLDRSGNVLNAQLPYEPSPSPSRRVSFSTDTGDDVHIIAHVARENDRSKVTVSSGFAVETADGVPILVTCAHTLEEVCCLPRCSVHVRITDVNKIRRSPLLVLPNSSPLSTTADLSHVPSSGSFVLSTIDSAPVTHPITSVLSSLHRSDLILMSLSPMRTALRSLPISPYPVPAGTAIRAHFVSETRPEEDGWQPWIGGTWSKWVQGTVQGYRDFAGREAMVSSFIVSNPVALDTAAKELPNSN